jgi:hypothetical protein
MNGLSKTSIRNEGEINGAKALMRASRTFVGDFARNSRSASKKAFTVAFAEAESWWCRPSPRPLSGVNIAT